MADAGLKWGGASPAQDAAEEYKFLDWYQNIANRIHINPNPDDPNHFYDYRSYYKDMKAGKPLTPPGQPGGHWDSDYKLPGSPRTYLDDGQGRVFNTVQAKYLTGEPVPDDRLKASERSDDMPGYDPERARMAQKLMGLLGRK